MEQKRRNQYTVPCVKARFWENTQKTDTCWLWTGQLETGGYGTLSVEGRCTKAHRIAWQLFKGPIPSKLCVLHTCDVRACVNPNHLFLGTYKDNMRDCMAKGRRATRNRAKLSLQDVADIQKSVREGGNVISLAKQYGVTTNRIYQIKHGG